MFLANMSQFYLPTQKYAVHIIQDALSGLRDTSTCKWLNCIVNQGRSCANSPTFPNSSLFYSFEWHSPNPAVLFFIFSLYMLILLGNHDLIHVWLWFQGTECRFLNKYFMVTIYSRGKAELSPPSMIQAVWYSPIMDSDLNEHVFKCINSAMVITQAGRSPLGGNSLGCPGNVWIQITFLGKKISHKQT